MSGILYLVPNTLGTVEQAGSLAFAIPEEVQAITARLTYFVGENAKSTRSFLRQVSSTHPLSKPMQEIRIAELNVNTPSSALSALLAPIEEGENGGLISEAGVPAVADPGANLVRMAHELGITVKPLVGPSSLLLALMASGLNGQSFAFNGYLPTDAGERGKRIRTLEERSRRERQTQIFIETPYRNGALLEALAATCQPKTLVCVATDLTLPSESVATLPAAEWKRRLAQGKAPDFHRRPTVFLLLAA